MMRAGLRILGALGSGASLALCFEPFALGWVVWGWMLVWLAVLWTVKRGRAGLRGFGLGCLAGMAFWVVNLKWLGSVTWPGVLALSAYLALYFGIFGAFASTVGNPWRRDRGAVTDLRSRLGQMGVSLGYAVVLGGFWCGLEWVRGWFLTGFGWNGLGVAFSENLVLAQSAEFVGVIGLSFLPVFFSVVLVQVVRRFWDQVRAGRVKLLHWDFAVALMVLMLALMVGTARIGSVTAAEKIPVRVLLVQQNIPQVAGQILWDSQRIVDGFIELTEDGMNEAAAEAARGLQRVESEDDIVAAGLPDLVVWPEACLPDFMRIDDDGKPQGGEILESLLGYVKSLGNFDFLVGVNEVEGETPWGPESRIFNSMVQLRATGERASYQKHHLVILGEYIPDLPFLHDLYRDATGVEFGVGMVPGESFEPLVTTIQGREIGLMPSICFEDTVPRVTRRFVRNEPQLMVNVTNDGWFGETEGAAQHYQNALFRSIELRRPMVRCANRGVTGVVTAAGSLVDPYTQERQVLVDEKGSHFHRGFLLATAYVLEEGGMTWYARWGDWFAVGGLILGLGWWMVRISSLFFRFP